MLHSEKQKSGAPKSPTRHAERRGTDSPPAPGIAKIVTHVANGPPGLIGPEPELRPLRSHCATELLGKKTATERLDTAADHVFNNIAGAVRLGAIAASIEVDAGALITWLSSTMQNQARHQVALVNAADELDHLGREIAASERPGKSRNDLSNRAGYLRANSYFRTADGLRRLSESIGRKLHALPKAIEKTEKKARAKAFAARMADLAPTLDQIAGDRDLREAAALVRLDEFIDQLPEWQGKHAVHGMGFEFFRQLYARGNYVEAHEVLAEELAKLPKRGRPHGDSSISEDVNK